MGRGLRFSGWIALLFVPVAFAAIEKGQPVADKCWTNSDAKTVCINDFKTNVRVLIHSAGWCGPCNEEMSQLAPRVKEFEGKPVTFISLSAYGWESGTMPDMTFLNEWKNKFKIPFPVAASPRDAGKVYFDPPLFIPNTVIIDRMGNLFYKEFAPEIDVLFDQVKAALAKDHASFRD